MPETQKVVDTKFIDEYNQMSVLEVRNRYKSDSAFRQKVDASGAVDVNLAEDVAPNPELMPSTKHIAEPKPAEVVQELEKPAEESKFVLPKEITPVPAMQPVQSVEPEEDDVYEKTSKGWQVIIDVQDGSGKQVFKGKTKAEVTRKLVEAQTNATKKIRQQQLQLKLGAGLVEWEKMPDSPEFVVKPLSAEEKYQLSQDLTDPAKMQDAYKRLKQADEEYQTMRRESWEAKQFEQARTIGDNWVSRNSEAFAIFRDSKNPNAADNRSILKQYFEKNNLAVTDKNLSLAFLDLTESGLLRSAPEPEESKEPKSSRVVIQEPDKVPKAATPVAPVPLVSPQPKAVAPIVPVKEDVVERSRSAPSSTGASSRGSSAVATPAAPTRPRLTVEEYNKMPARDVRRRIQSGDKDFIADLELLASQGKI